LEFFFPHRSEHESLEDSQHFPQLIEHLQLEHDSALQLIDEQLQQESSQQLIDEQVQQDCPQLASHEQL
jgi:hypothetical protein